MLISTLFCRTTCRGMTPPIWPPCATSPVTRSHPQTCRLRGSSRRQRTRRHATPTGTTRPAPDEARLVRTIRPSFKNVSGPAAGWFLEGKRKVNVKPFIVTVTFMFSPPFPIMTISTLFLLILCRHFGRVMQVLPGLWTYDHI